MIESVKLVPMKCPGCGAGLQISPTMESFACGYCGTSIRAVREGGTVALVAEAIARIQTGTNKTAAELALVRLKDDLKTNNLSIEQMKATEPPTFVPEKFPLWSLQDTARLIWLVLLFLVGLAVFFAYGLLDKNWWMLVLCFVALFSHFRQSHRAQLEKRNAFNRDSANNAKREFDRQMEELCTNRKSIEIQIEKNIAIVNSSSS